MKTTFLLLISIAAISAKESKNGESKCEGVHISGKLHKGSVIINGVDRPYQLAMYDKDHKVFFSTNVGDDKKDTFQIAYVRENDTKPTEIKNITNGFAIAVDPHTHTAYFGGSDGVYADNLEKSDGIKHIVKDYDIWDMFFHHRYHHLYFIAYPSQRLHKCNEKGKNATILEQIHEKIYQFVIDGDNDIFITTKDGLHVIKNGTSVRIPYTGPKVYRAIEVNHAGVAHFCSKDFIYVAHKENYTLVEIAKIENIFGLTFDSSDNFIYSNPHEIIKLLPSDCKSKTNH